MKKLLLILIIIIAAAGWYFLRPKTLGVGYASVDLQSAKQKLAVTYLPLPADGSTAKTLTVTGSHPVDKTFSSQELTALADNRRKDYAYFPFRNVQIRVNDNGTVEGTATVNYPDLSAYLVALGVSYEDIEAAAAKFNVPRVNLPVYLKASGNISNNRSQISVSAAQIANISVPKNFLDKYSPTLNQLIETVISDRQPGYRIDKLEVVGGQIHFKGTAPDVEMAAKTSGN